MTYPDMFVAHVLNDYFIPVQINVSEGGELLKKYQVIWTPNLNVINADGTLFDHREGWFPPSEFVPMAFCGYGHYLLRNNNYKEAGECFDWVFVRYPASRLAPEALYYKGVSNYLASHEVDDLKQSWIMLQRFYPESTWSIRSHIL
ncbi:MAG: hypothetical protein R6U50_09685 [Desulfobacterales bacterium]